MDEGESRVENDKGQGVVNRQSQLTKGRHQPHQDETQPKRHCPKEQENPAAAPAGAEPVGEQAKERVVDRVPNARDADRPTGVIGAQAGHIRQEKELEKHQDGQRDTRA